MTDGDNSSNTAKNKKKDGFRKEWRPKYQQDSLNTSSQSTQQSSASTTSAIPTVQSLGPCFVGR